MLKHPLYINIDLYDVVSVKFSARQNIKFRQMPIFIPIKNESFKDQ